jgi:hypothetical protein
MKKGFKVGEYVHVPAETMVWNMDDAGDIRSYLRIQSPVALMCLGSRRDHKFNDSIMYNVFYEGKVFSVSEDDVYSLEDE